MESAVNRVKDRMEISNKLSKDARRVIAGIVNEATESVLIRLLAMYEDEDTKTLSNDFIWDAIITSIHDNDVDACKQFITSAQNSFLRSVQKKE
jgi:hypothetical protein